MSSTFLSLLYFRSIQWNVASDQLIQLAKDTITHSIEERRIPEKTALYQIAYLYRFSPEWCEKILIDQSPNGMWSQFHHSTLPSSKQRSRLTKIEAQMGKNLGAKSLQNLLSTWPSLWERHEVTSDLLQWLMTQLAKQPVKNRWKNIWEHFAGVSSETVLKALREAKNEDIFLFILNELYYLLDQSHLEDCNHLIRQLLQSTKDLASTMQKIPKRFSAYINSQENGKGPYDIAFQEQIASLHSGKKQLSFRNISRDQVSSEHDNPARGLFFDLAYRNSTALPKADIQDDFWSALSVAWTKPMTDQLDKLSELARQMPAVYQLCYIDTLGRFKGIDTAPLKLLDYIRSQEENVLRSVINALAQIKTNRSTQELVSFLTRPNVSVNLQMEITQLLKDCDLSRLQHELRSAINDLRPDASSDEPIWELRETLTNFLNTDDGQEQVQKALPTDQPTTDDLDRMLKQRIASFDLLSGEAKRALRTAQFFHMQVGSSGNMNTIDLSPAIDMQYKALELSFREKFEDITGAVIREGTLQRKLDVIGYARPIPRAMDDFERYIENLDIIKSIPFFSRFKLRKMLRAICQFRPGRRFTLDGLKAFALFFICFSRKQCRYGLNNILPIPQLSDEDLYQFCKALHVFQDFRNRAAHEGFHPDASNDLDGIWLNTSHIIEGMIQIESLIRENWSQRSSLKTG